MLSCCGVVGDEGSKENRRSKEYLSLLEISGEVDLENSVFTILCELVTVMRDFISKECNFSHAKPCLGELAVDVAFDASVKDFFKVIVEVLKGVCTDKDVVKDCDGEIGHVRENISHDAL